MKTETPTLTAEVASLRKEVAELRERVSLWRHAIEYMSQYNGRSVHDCLELAREECGFTVTA